MLRLSGFALMTVTSVVLWPILAWPRDETPNVVIQWNNAALQGVRDSKLGPPMVARALAIVHTCIYDAWAAYDRHALGTQFGGSLRHAPRPPVFTQNLQQERGHQFRRVPRRRGPLPWRPSNGI